MLGSPMIETVAVFNFLLSAFFGLQGLIHEFILELTLVMVLILFE